MRDPSPDAVAVGDKGVIESKVPTCQPPLLTKQTQPATNHINATTPDQKPSVSPSRHNFPVEIKDMFVWAGSSHSIAGRRCTRNLRIRTPLPGNDISYRLGGWSADHR
ncbi:hypothetical protein TNIN_5961 [Trichonephila inaurata madagascariensis]|uniref:Uncharacterized protein n=1 Tax=Trichonephila inaurata madagascariensis TaxID=2747483 RepID=A0A8X6XPA7_9ARAC|nr:hypothetical protein TNIN_5961 [Trichonephila inaurata madagascariensis]